MGTDVRSLCLASRPSFLEGVSRLLDFGNTLSEYNTSRTSAQADFFAIGIDWRLIGYDWADVLADMSQDVEEGP